MKNGENLKIKPKKSSDMTFPLLTLPNPKNLASPYPTRETSTPGWEPLFQSISFKSINYSSGHLLKENLNLTYNVNV